MAGAPDESRTYESGDATFEIECIRFVEEVERSLQVLSESEEGEPVYRVSNSFYFFQPTCFSLRMLTLPLLLL